MRDNSLAFGPKANDYALYRWDYAAQAIDQLWADTGLGPDSVVADVGAGTGMLAAHFTGRAGRVFAIEPNDDMRLLARQALGECANVRVSPGYSHATGLDPASVDLITAGRALHWFDAAPSRAEFRRVLRPGGWLAVLMTETTDPYLSAEMRGLHHAEFGWDVRYAKKDVTPADLEFYYGGPGYQRLAIVSRVRETWPQFAGRVGSISSAPNPGDPLYTAFAAALRDIFERGAAGGVLGLEYTTTVYLGQIVSA